jgi:D-amino peptidase
MTDIEGVAGVISFEDQGYASGKYHQDAKKLLTGEINAAIEGAMEAGVTDILVNDGHGCGGIHYESLHESARILQGGPREPKEQWYGKGQYDVSCMIGQHAMEGALRGTLNHTQSSQGVDYYKLNGKYIGEIAQWALYMGYFGVPIIFLSGDTAACREAEKLIPGITTCAVKDGISRTCAVSLAMPAAHKLIREKMKESVLKHERNPVKPLVWKGPFRLEIRFKHSNLADQYVNSDWQRVDTKTVARKSNRLIDVIHG